MFETNAPAWLAWVRDEEISAAYEQIPDEWLALLKTGIALNHFLYGAFEGQTDALRVSGQSGIKSLISKTSVPWSILIFGPDVQAAAQITALAITCRLAGVKDVLAVLPESYSSGALVALAQCGIEDICALSAPAIEQLLDHATSFKGPGRIAFLQQGSLATLIPLAPVPCVNLNQRARLLLAAPADFDLAALKFCQGPEIGTNENAASEWDAVFTKQKSCLSTRMTLGPGCEGFWAFPQLSPDFFIEQTVSLNLI